MFKSIRWTLLFWYALILILVVSLFTALVSIEMWNSTMQSVDDELRAHAHGISSGLEMNKDGSFELTLSDPYVDYFNQQTSNPPFYAIWGYDGELIATSNPSLDIQKPDRAGEYAMKNMREVAVSGKYKTLVLVGKDVRDKRASVDQFVSSILVTGAIIFIFGMIGGWFLAGRVTSPIKRISETAASISEFDLSKRVQVSTIENEFKGLAKTLNETFDLLQAAFERQTAFTADASHELRTPLSILISHIQLSLKKERTTPEYQKTLETCLRSAERMRAVVEGLLTLARADAGEMVLKLEDVDIVKTLEDTISLLKPMADQKKVSVNVRQDNLVLKADRDRLQEAFTNLISNAIRYNKEGGNVDASINSNGEFAEISVTDTGIGIPAEAQKFIFERFYRVDKTRSRSLGGSGLGLAITKLIVEAHGGTISFSSKEDIGTTFTIKLKKT